MRNSFNPAFLIVFLGCALVILKALGLISLSWVWVTVPFWVGIFATAILIAAVFVLVFIVALIIAAIGLGIWIWEKFKDFRN
jgi:hypothetical protein